MQEINETGLCSIIKSRECDKKCILEINAEGNLEWKLWKKGKQEKW